MATCIVNQKGEKVKVPRDVLDSFTDKMLEHIQNGRSYPEALDALSESSGLKRDTINDLFKRDPKSFSLTKQTIARAGRVRSLRDAADALAGDLKTNGKLYQEPGMIAKTWDIQRQIALKGHSTIFPWSHMRNWVVQIPTEAGRERMGAFWRAATDVFRYAGVKGAALHEMDMSLMQRGDRYDFFKQSGADIAPGKLGPGDILLQGRKPNWQTRNFDSLKVARYTNLDAIWSHLDPALKQGDTGKAMGAMIARDMNYATGSVMPPVGEAANVMAKTGAQLSQMAGHYNALMASKLFFAKHMDAIFTPLRYISKKIAGNMTPAENAASNVALKRWGNTVAAHLSILGANYAFNKAMGWQTPNLTDPTKSDFLRARLGNWVIPFSPILESIRIPVVFTAAMATKGSDSGGQVLWRALWNAAHPAAHTLYEQASGKDFQGRPVPSIHNLISPVKSKLPPEGPLEYFSTRLSPIAISGGLHEFYQELRDQGINATMSMAILKGLGAGAASALVGIHGYEQEPKPEKGASRTKPLPPSGVPHQTRGAKLSGG